MRQDIAYVLIVAIIVGLVVAWRWARAHRRRDSRSIRYRVVPRIDENE